MSPDRPSLVRVRYQRSALLSRCMGKPPMTMVSPHKGTIMWKMREITNVLLFAFKIVYYFASSVQFITWILLHVWHGYHRYLWDFLHHIHSGDNWCDRWQLMWPFRFVAVPVCGRFGLWPFRFVGVPVCGHSSLWPFRFMAVSVCGRFGLWPFRLWPFRFVAVMTCYLSGCVSVCVRQPPACPRDNSSPVQARITKFEP